MMMIIIRIIYLKKNAAFNYKENKKENKKNTNKRRDLEQTTKNKIKYI